MPAAARAGDVNICPACGAAAHLGGAVGGGSATVSIGGMSAACAGDTAACAGGGGPITSGSPTVFINGKPAARVGDATSHAGMVVIGASTVNIGDTPGKIVDPAGPGKEETPPGTKTTDPATKTTGLTIGGKPVPTPLVTALLGLTTAVMNDPKRNVPAADKQGANKAMAGLQTALGAGDLTGAQGFLQRILGYLQGAMQGAMAGLPGMRAAGGLPLATAGALAQSLPGVKGLPGMGTVTAAADAKGVPLPGAKAPAGQAAPGAAGAAPAAKDAPKAAPATGTEGATAANRPPLPQRLEVVDRIARQYPAALYNSCQERGGSWEFVDRVLITLRGEDPRWGYHAARGAAAGISFDALAYHHGDGPGEGSTDISVVVIVAGRCTASPRPAFIDTTLAMRGAGTLGNWTGGGRF